MTPFEIIGSPLSLWLAPLGTAFPLIDVAPAIAWKLIGTNGTANQDDQGVVVSLNQKVEVARPAGRTGPVKAWISEEDCMISIGLWDLSLEQLQYALAGVAPTTVAAGTGTAGYKKTGLTRGVEVTQYALLARGVSPYADNMNAQFEVPRVYQSGSPKPKFGKGKPAGLDLEFTALEDLAAATPAERFGRLVAQHQLAL
jgi:hypothetical protein